MHEKYWFVKQHKGIIFQSKSTLVGPKAFLLSAKKNIFQLYNKSLINQAWSGLSWENSSPPPLLHSVLRTYVHQVRWQRDVSLAPFLQALIKLNKHKITFGYHLVLLTAGYFNVYTFNNVIILSNIIKFLLSYIKIKIKTWPTIISISCLQIAKSCMLLTEIRLRACRFPLGTLTRNTREKPPVYWGMTELNH